MTKIIPLGKRVLVTMILQKESIVKGIIIPGKNESYHETANIVAVGDGVEDLNIGDMVLLNKFKGQMFKVDEIDYIMINLEDVMALLEPDQNGISSCTGSEA
jgi:chaperonin GroES